MLIDWLNEIENTMRKQLGTQLEDKYQQTLDILIRQLI